MSKSDDLFTSINCVFDTIVAYLMPFYLAGAKGDTKLARNTILELVRVYRTATPAEIELAGRIMGLSAAAADSLRLSMRPNLSDTMILRYRNNALALNRAAEKCQAALEAMQEGRQQSQPPAPEPRPKPAAPAPSHSIKEHAFAAMGHELQAMRAAAAAAPLKGAADDPGRGQRA
ncbi:MAG: hypothetical protein P4L90_02080 [Rhodopila sp.]|nr:hypothetical protein [Rhodopila sp.]